MLQIFLTACAISLAYFGNCERHCKRNPGGIITLDAYPGNGEFAGIGEYPWAVAIEVHGGIQCAGALIMREVVLTAAHCIPNIKSTKIFVLAGVWNVSNANADFPSQRIAVKNIKVHPGFSTDYHGIANDISVLFLDRSVTLNNYVSTICLTNKSTINEPCFLTGWGSLEYGGNQSQIPKNLTLPIVPHDECEKMFANSNKLDKNFTLSEKQICAGGLNGSDACFGDGGAPLVCPVHDPDDRFILIGLTSWGIGCNSQFPGVYTKVSNFIDWINQIVEAEGFNSSKYLI